MIYEYIISSILAFIVAFSITPAAKRLAFKIGAVDVPKDGRRMHKKPIARLGGLAIVAGFFVSIIYNVTVAAFDKAPIFLLNNQLLGFLAGAVIVVAMGVIDDIFTLRARYKLIFQVAAAAIVIFTGTRIENVTNPFAATGMSTLNITVSYIITILWIVGITNALNLIDGLDGLAAGVSSIASFSLFVVSMIIGDSNAALLTAVLTGATLGFLPYNFNPAKIFMSDTGAQFLGFSLSFISIQGSLKSYATISIAIPLLVLGLPLFDTIFAIIRRVGTKKPIMEADRGHLHHRLMDLGLSQRQAVIIMYILSGTLGLAAIVLADKGFFSAILLIIAVAVFIIGGARYITSINASKDDTSTQEDKENDK